MSDVLDSVQRRLSDIPADGLRADSPLGCVRILREVRLGFRDATGKDGQPCRCGGLLRPYIESRSMFPWHRINLGLRCDNPDCDVLLVEDWRQDECRKCGHWMEVIEPNEAPEWWSSSDSDNLLWCRECEHYVTVTDIKSLDH